MLKIDMHNHIIPKELPRWADKFGYGDFIHLEHNKPGYADMMKGDTFFRTIASNCWDAEERIEEYKQYDTDIQVICTIPVLFSYWAEPQDGLDISRFLNDDIATTVQNHPKHYIGLGTVPMQDTELAIQEMKRCKELGFPGLQIGSNIGDVNLDDDRFFPFFKACAEEGMSLFIHPWNMMGKPQMEKYWLPWLVGMPAETSRAICSLIFGGVFERLPELRVCFAHAGGSFLPTIGRIEHGYNCRPDLVAINNKRNPREYLGKFWIDNITHDTQSLDYMIDMIGSERICLGSDYPFPLGDLTIGELLTEMNLSEDQLKDIRYRSALDWLGLKEEELVINQS